ncbi:uncharacterized protein [Apostichopus japonicus]|uniref:uncharacterized protein isoform X2 n=1 Tax=Stichopus japonicus TaxID=307972 RepID=UPI003AB71182
MDRPTTAVFITFSLLIIAASSLTTEPPNMSAIITDCCGRGISFASMGQNCSGMAGFPDVAMENRAKCEAIFMSCCHNQMSSASCDEGILLQLNEGECESSQQLETCNSYSAEKECCDCCGLGIEAYHEGMACDSMSIRTPCDHAFEACCKKTKQEFDVDECSLQGQLVCMQRCINTIGSFKCGCRPGWHLAADGYSCYYVTSMPTMNPCSDSPCSQGCQILGDTGGYECICSQGYRLALNGITCLDINECVELAEPCARGQSCSNSPGSFFCSAASGFPCPTGLRYNPSIGRCEDIDECAENTDDCTSLEECVNSRGSYTCQSLQYTCSRGLRYNAANGICTDINECLEESHNCPSSSTCFNIHRGYRCQERPRCASGYQVDPVTSRCIDINECYQNSGACPEGQRCENYEGGFRCARRFACGTGYNLNSVTQDCEDVNECEQRLHRCQRNQRCVNEPGSHLCENCESGYRVDIRNECTIDIDECAERTDTCTANQICYNTLGAFTCTCNPGFNQDSVHQDCVDIDECNPDDGSSPCLPNQMCINFPGSYDCQNMCSYGARYIYGTCFDIDECAEGTHQCEDMQECINQEGGHLCRCPLGYRLTRSSSRGCEDVDECTALPTSCRGGCENTDGSYRCLCPEGYNLSENGYSCNDIDECALGLHSCDQEDQECFNTLGSYKCRSIACPQYFERRLSRKCFKEQCAERDQTCRSLPGTISYRFISIDTGFPVPVEVFKESITPDPRYQYQFKLTKGKAKFFSLVTGENMGTIKIMRAIEGPRSFELRLELRVIRDGDVFAKYVTIIYLHIEEDVFG